MFKILSQQRRWVGGVVVTAAATATSVNSIQCRGISHFRQPMLQVTEPVKLYQYDVCPFCNKVQAFLEYQGIPFEKVEVNPLTKKEIKFSEYKMVPLAIINGQQVNGSSAIIETLMGQNIISEREKEWCSWVDSHLVHLLPPNIYRTPSEALESFNYITSNSNFSVVEGIVMRYAGAAVMFLIAKRSKEKYGLSDNPRQDLFDAVEHWSSNGIKSSLYHGGDEPDAADLAVYGVLRSIVGDNYETWKDLENHSFASRNAFFKWFEAMKNSVNNNL